MAAERTLLLDAGVWIASRDPEDRHQAASLELTFATEQAAAMLDLTLYEVANGVIRRWNDPRAATRLCRSIELRCKENVIRVDSSLIEATAEIATDHDLTSYDAAYVAVARRYDWQLVSTDIEDLVSRGLAIAPDRAV
ncbi:MAG: type II toxin-antitoxin system VapC family toxin [Actinobacteria bacterium]|nr:type II toxin-antitoxin system VapC family toxin [Actinomycetota bacterium]MBS1883530.1 type II toxin-antitoxin system VapC family toxin [Actinomycetota bacterium]